jgi:hypothetical protein
MFADATADHPYLMALIGRHISIWAWIDAEYANLTAEFLTADHRVVCELLNGIISSDARRGAILGAARAALDAARLDLFDAIWTASAASRRRRNDFAHGLWGSSDDLPDSLIWADAKDIARNDFELIA